jgi:DNA-binding NtrC family response regulator
MQKLLLVDDDAQFAEMMLKAVTSFGYEPILAATGKEALQLYDPKTVELVITDLLMPDMEGVELIMALRRRNPKVKFIAISGGGRNSADTYLNVARKLGALKTLTKPFPLEALRTAISECLTEPRNPSGAQ